MPTAPPGKNRRPLSCRFPSRAGMGCGDGVGTATLASAGQKLWDGERGLMRGQTAWRGSVVTQAPLPHELYSVAWVPPIFHSLTHPGKKGPC